MNKSIPNLRNVSLFALALLICACATAPTTQNQEPQVPIEEQPAVDVVSPSNYVCGTVTNETDTGAFTPVLTDSISGQQIYLEAIYQQDQNFINYGPFPVNFIIIYDPIVEQSYDLQGNPSSWNDLTGYSSYELVANCP
jgi:hypothetical protein